MKKVIYLSLIVIFILVCIISLAKTFHISNLSIILFLPLSFGLILLSYLIRAYSNPPKWLFRLRFIIYSIQYGLYFGIAMSVFNLIEKQQLDITKFIYYTVGFSLLGFFVGEPAYESYFKFRKLIKKTSSDNATDLAQTDSAYYVDSEMYRTSGRLIFENDKLCFFSAEDNECLFESNISDVNPVIEKSSLFKLPIGLDFQKNEIKIFMKFPQYWLNLIKKEQTNPF